LTLVLDLPVSVGLGRASARRAKITEAADAFEARNMAFHERLRQGFLDIAADEPSRCAVIDASGTADAIATEIARLVRERLGVEFP
jgi:dTMP kinase